MPAAAATEVVKSGQDRQVSKATSCNRRWRSFCLQQSRVRMFDRRLRHNAFRLPWLSTGVTRFDGTWGKKQV